MVHFRKILRTVDYSLVKFELISSTEVKKASKEVEKNFKKNREKLQN